MRAFSTFHIENRECLPFYRAVMSYDRSGLSIIYKSHHNLINTLPTACRVIIQNCPKTSGCYAALCAETFSAVALGDGGI